MTTLKTEYPVAGEYTVYTVSPLNMEYTTAMKVMVYSVTALNTEYSVHGVPHVQPEYFAVPTSDRLVRLLRRTSCILFNVLCSLTDDCCFLLLDNGVALLLARDPQSKHLAASVSVHAGASSDPRSLSGVAHFTGHMCFLGSRVCPEENAYKRDGVLPPLIQRIAGEAERRIPVVPVGPPHRGHGGVHVPRAGVLARRGGGYYGELV